jgi:hypothetical protein
MVIGTYVGTEGLGSNPARVLGFRVNKILLFGNILPKLKSSRYKKYIYVHMYIYVFFVLYCANFFTLGVNVMITILGHFANFRRKNSVFRKNQCYDQNFS